MGKMYSSGMCSQCLCALRQTIKAEAGASRAHTQIVSSRRYLSSASTRWQQQSTPTNTNTTPERPMFIPTTAATVTTNVTAPPEPEVPQSSQSQATPEHKLSSSLSTSTPSSSSVSQMQRQIQSGLANSRPKSLPERLASSLQKAAPSVTKTYTIYGRTEALFKSCAAQADYTIPQDQRMNVLTGKGPAKDSSQEGAEIGQPLPEVANAWWFRVLNLPPTFSTWSQITFLHMYVIIAQLRAAQPTQSEFQDYHRYLIEHFSREAEDKMVLLHNLNAQGIRSRYLKDLLLQWRGILVSYDEGLVKGDAVLASAIWRNLFRADENVDWVKVASVVTYVRLAIRKVGSMDMDQLVAGLGKGQTVWPTASSMGSITTLVGRSSQAINVPLE